MNREGSCKEGIRDCTGRDYAYMHGGISRDDQTGRNYAYRDMHGGINRED